MRRVSHRKQRGTEQASGVCHLSQNTEPSSIGAPCHSAVHGKRHLSIQQRQMIPCRSYPLLPAYLSHSQTSAKVSILPWAGGRTDLNPVTGSASALFRKPCP